MRVKGGTGVAVIFISLIIGLGFAVYANSLAGEFIWDDLAFVRDNKFIRDWTNITNIFTKEPTWGLDVGGGKVRYNLYRPLQWVTFMADYSLWKLKPFGYHLTNTVLHILTALGVFWLIAILFGDRLLSLLTAAFFIVHPVHTEAVAYISGRADPLALLFLSISFIFYIKYVNEEKPTFYIAAFISCILALLSRESSLILPALLLLYHFTFKKRVRPKVFLPFLGITAVFLIFRLLMTRVLLVGRSIPVGTLIERLPGAFVAIADYIRLLIIPLNLHMEYGNPVFSFCDPRVIVGIAVLILSLTYAFRRRKEKIMFFSVFWFYITLIPSLNIYPIGAYMAEHWLYLPSIGFFLFAGGLILSPPRPVRPVGSNRVRNKYIVIVISVPLVLFYSFLTIQQNNYWKGLIPFYERTLNYAPDSARLYSNLGVAYSDAARYEEALAVFEKALEIEPKLLEVHYNLGTVYFNMSRYEEAIDHFKKEIIVNPGYFKAYSNLGAVYIDLGRYEEAIEIFNKTLELESNRVEVYCNLGFAYYKLGRYEEAVASYKKALEIDPNYPKAYNDLGMVFHTAARYREAIAAYKKAIGLNPDYAEIYFNLGIAYEAVGERKEAISAYKSAIELKPDYAAVHNNLAIAYFHEGKFNLAIDYCNKAIELGYKVSPKFLDALQPHR